MNKMEHEECCAVPDVWSLGVILYMLVCGQAPFQEANDSETLTMIMDCKYTIPIHVSDSCKRWGFSDKLLEVMSGLAID